MNRLYAAALAAVLPLSACAQEDTLKPFPDASAGQQRYVISLPEQTDENLFKVEIVAGKTLKTDCNTRRLAGDLEEKNLDGWGYSYYQIPEPKGPISTLMACPPGTEKQAFVPLIGQGYLLRYNSKLPIVIYAPKDIEVNYRLWRADDQAQAAELK